MSKKRVYDVSKELKISQRDLLALIRDLGGKVRGPMSIVDIAMIAKVNEYLEAKRKEVEKHAQKKVEKERRLAEKGLKIKKEKEKKERDRQKKDSDKKSSPIRQRDPRYKKKESPKEPVKKQGLGESAVVTAPPTQEKRKRSRRRRPERPDDGSVSKSRPVPKTGPVSKSRPVPKTGPVSKSRPVPKTGPVSKSKPDRKKKIRERGKKEALQTIRKTMSAPGGISRPRRQKKRVKEGFTIEEVANVINISEFTSVGELANLIEVSPAQVIAKCMGMGLMVTINQRLDADTITMVADEFGYEANLVDPFVDFAEQTKEEQEEEQEENLRERPPIVTVMGHVDHGKTSLLDYIRNSNITAKEFGGITQHIGAYSIVYEGNKITFLDTPGHQAFTGMRARGAQVTDVVILIIAASERVMPQTIEAIDHAKAADVPIIVAINKIDLPTAHAERVRQDLTKYGVIVEEYGGDVPSVEISAKKGTNIDTLLELVMFQAELLDLKANYERKAQGVILESRLDRGRGPVATVLINKGALHVGDNFIAGDYYGRVRAIFDDIGKPTESAEPSMPVEVLGFSGIPQTGDTFKVVEDDRTARQISSKRQLLRRERDVARRPQINLENLFEQIKSGMQELNLIIKADTMGSVEAISDALLRLGNEEIKLKVLHQSIGEVTENDVNLAVASRAIIVGFHVTASSSVRDLARQNKVDIRPYRVIFEAVDDIKKAIEGLLRPELREEIIGLVEIRAIFSIPKHGQIAGCYVKEGVVKRNANARVIRDGIIIQEDRLSSLKRFKDDVREVASGFECGLGLQNFSDIKAGDFIEFFVIEEVARKLD